MFVKILENSEVRTRDNDIGQAMIPPRRSINTQKWLLLRPDVQKKFNLI